MEYAFSAFGGFIVGTSYVVDHQRISGLGNLKFILTTLSTKGFSDLL